MPKFEEVLNSLLRIGNIDIYVIGSNSKFLSNDIITEFRDRGDVTLYRWQNSIMLMRGILMMPGISI